MSCVLAWVLATPDQEILLAGQTNAGLRWLQLPIRYVCKYLEWPLIRIQSTWRLDLLLVALG